MRQGTWSSQTHACAVVHTCAKKVCWQPADVRTRDTLVVVGLPHRQPCGGLLTPPCCLCLRPDQFCGRWTTNPNFGVTNFDNIVWACNTIFMCISLEGWTQVMYFAQDAVSSWSWVRHAHIGHPSLLPSCS